MTKSRFELVPVVPEPHRVPGMVQLPLAHVEVKGRRVLESFVIFMIFAIVYGVLGYWLVVDMRIVTFDSLDRLTNAYLAWHNDPAKLAAVGFSLPPLQTLVLLPFTIIAGMATSLVALPICSAIFGGLSMVALNRLMERCEVDRPIRYVVVALFGITPTIAFYGMSGGSELVSLFFLTAAMSGLIAWVIQLDTRFLISSGVAFAFSVMSDYATFVWAALAAIMVIVVLARHKASEKEVTGSLITYLAPTVYAFLVWSLTNVLIVNSPFGWMAAAKNTSVDAGNASLHLSFVHVLTTTLQLAWSSAPMILFVIPALLAVAVIQKATMAAWLAAFSLLALLTPGADLLIYHTGTSVDLDRGVPMLMMSVAGAAYLYGALPDARAPLGFGMIIGMLATVALVWTGVNHYKYQNMEQAFRVAISSRGHTHPTKSLGGVQVGITQELAMAHYLQDHSFPKKSILTDNSQTYAVILLTGKPAIFNTRIDRGDGPWLREVSNPPARVKYFLVARNDTGDYVASSYPALKNVVTDRFNLLYEDARYELVAIAPQTNLTNAKPPAVHTTKTPGSTRLSKVDGIA